MLVNERPLVIHARARDKICRCVGRNIVPRSNRTATARRHARVLLPCMQVPNVVMIGDRAKGGNAGRIARGEGREGRRLSNRRNEIVDGQRNKRVAIIIDFHASNRPRARRRSDVTADSSGRVVRKATILSPLSLAINRFLENSCNACLRPGVVDSADSAACNVRDGRPSFSPSLGNVPFDIRRPFSIVLV